MNLSVLVVDASPAARAATCRDLRGAGFDVIEAAGGAEALRLARRRPDVTVLELDLPDLEGLEVCRRLKADPETASIPVLCLSAALRDAASRVRALEAGADAHLARPAAAAELIATVRALRRRRVDAGDEPAPARGENAEALALENARLYQEAEQRRAAAESLASVGSLLLRSLEPREVGCRIVDSLRALLGTQHVSLYQIDPASLDLTLLALAGDAGPAIAPGFTLFGGSGVAGLAVRQRRPVVTPDLLADRRIRLQPDARASIEAAPYRAVAAIPLVAQDRAVGVVSVGDAAGRVFTEGDLALLQSFADQAAVALENARLFAAERAARADAEASEARFRESQQTLRAVIDAVPAIINAKDLDSRYIFMNRFQAEVYGVSVADAVGRRAGDFLGAEYGAYTEGLDRRVASEGTTLAAYEEDYRDARGVVRSWLTTKVPLRDPTGQVRGVATIAQDMTERKHLEAQLRQAQKMEAIGRLAGGVAHDFNNLLTVIAGRAELLRRYLEPDHRLRKHVDLIRKTAERAAALTRQLLAFSRRQTIQPRVVEPSQVVAGMEKMLRRLIGEHIELRMGPGVATGCIKVDPGQLEQVLLNLAVNARDAMPEGGRLTVETDDVALDEAFARQHSGARPGRYVRLAVSDTGVGMDAATLANVFEPFFTTKGVGRGTGLGLAMVYGIVKQSEGYITVASEPGKGARFDLYFPRVNEAPAPEPGSPALPELLRGAETILLVEDQDDVRDLARDVLELSGYQVLEARNGAHALRVAAAHAPPIHLLVTDVVMPQLGGRELAATLGAARPGMRVVFMSGYAAEALGPRGVVDPGVPFIQKPFAPEALARKVREVLDAPGDARP
jgi:PAS domain S-box-containing protein